MALTVGNLVVHSAVPGIGRVGEIAGKQVRLECFESVAEPVVSQIWAEASACRRVRLARQTRVFWQNPDTGLWRAGRIVGGDPSGYFVRLPNSEQDTIVAEADLRVRWDRSVANPLDVLLAGANESPYFRDARLPMLQSLVEQRAACASNPAMLSSAVEFYPHQIRAAFTVLNDPVQRYLLADEVGLGKTIEAGYIIRQLLLDHPRANIAIIAPDTLRRQWRGELLDKFFIDDFPSATVKISPHEAPNNWAAYHGFELVVVDEAHRLVRVEDRECPPYRQLRELARSVPRLLLLSATPMMQDETITLSLLHLLDPQLYRWDDVGAFRQRLQLRKQLATAVFSLVADYEYLLPEVIAEIEALTPADDRLRELAGGILELLTGTGDLRSEDQRATLATRVEALRAHLGETYRLHRRVIRHRRAEVLRADQDVGPPPFEVRGRTRPQVVNLDSAVHNSGQEALLTWRAEVNDWLLNHDAEERSRQYGQVLAVLLSRTGGPIHDVMDVLRWRLNQDAEAADRAGLSPEERRLVAEPDVLPIERPVLDQLVAFDDASVTSLTEGLLPIRETCPRLVVFCGLGSLAARLADDLKARQLQPVHEHTVRMGAEAAEGAVQAWLQTGGVLIADSAAEYGRNLQAADGVVHCRLPWSPNDLEQRIGRVDRYGSSAPAQQYVVGDDAGTEHFAGAWLRLLTDGVGIFQESVSALQEPLDQRGPELWRHALSNGPAGLVDAASDLRAVLREERREVDRFDALEASYEATTSGRDLAVALDDLEVGWKQLRDATVNYAGSNPGGLRLRIHTAPDQTTRIDRGALDPLVSPRLLAGMAAIPPGSRVGMFNRARALRHPGTRMLRIGNPVIDALEQVVTVDDRGQASAHWRVDVRHHGEAEAYFGFHYLIEAAIKDALALVEHTPDAKRALRRQADRSFPPFLRRIWMPSSDLKAVDDPELLAWLERPYANNAADRNLNVDRLVSLHHLFGDADSFADSARRADAAGRDELARVTDLAERAQGAAEYARQRLAIMAAQAAARRLAGRLLSDTESFLMNVRVTEALITGLSAPHIRLVSVTCLVRSQTPWSEDVD
jgi:ATP-dependent helicase HepA